MMTITTGNISNIFCQPYTIISFTTIRSKVTFGTRLHHYLVKELHSEAENTTETDNIESQKIELIQEVTKSNIELYIVGCLIIILIAMLGIGIGIYIADSLPMSPPCRGVTV